MRRSSIAGPGRSLSRPRTSPGARTTSPPASSATSSGRRRRCAPLRSPSATASRTSPSSCPRRRHGGSASRALQCRRLLRADRALRSHRLGLHVGRHRQGGGRQDGCRLLDALSRRGHSPARALCHAHRRRRRDHDARRRAGDRRAGVRTVHGQACRHRGRPGQQVRGRGQARALRQGRHRRVRRPDRDRHHRRRQRRSCVWLRPISSARPSTGTRARRG